MYTRASRRRITAFIFGITVAAGLVAGIVSSSWHANAGAFVVVVNSAANTDDGFCEGPPNPGLGDCTLREAINEVNVGPANLITFSVSGTIDLSIGDLALPAITAGMTIDATGQTVTLDGNGSIAYGLLWEPSADGMDFQVIGSSSLLTIREVTDAIVLCGTTGCGPNDVTFDAIRLAHVATSNISDSGINVDANDVTSLTIEDSLVVADDDAVRLRISTSGPNFIDTVNILRNRIVGDADSNGSGDGVNSKFSSVLGSLSTAAINIRDNQPISGSDGLDIDSELCCGDRNLSAITVDDNNDIVGHDGDGVRIRSVVGSFPGGDADTNTSRVSVSRNGTITGVAGDGIAIESMAGSSDGDGDANLSQVTVNGNGNITGMGGSGIAIHSFAGGANPGSDTNVSSVSASNNINIIGRPGDGVLIDVTFCCDPSDANSVAVNNNGTITGLGLPDSDGIDVNATNAPTSVVTIRGNRVSNSDVHGIDLCCGNFAGSQARDNTIANNGASGIFLQDSTSGVVLGPNNIISGNGSGTGIHIEGDGSDHNTITRNSIFDNQDLGIDLPDPTGVGCTDPTGPNECLPFPMLTFVGSNKLSGTACANCTVEVFLTDNSPADQDNHGEGKTFVVSCVASNAGNFSCLLPCGLGAGLLTSTATDVDGNTSEFSLNFAFAGTAACPTATSTATVVIVEVTPTFTPTPTPTPPPSVGGISIDPGAGASGGDPGVLAGTIVGTATGAIALGGGVWYARRRRVR